MTTISKGDYVAAVTAGSGSYVRGYGAARYQVGEELEVTSDRGASLNVRRAGGGPVFKVSRSKVAPVKRMIGEVPPDGLAPDDPRLEWLFEDAGRMADRLGLCKDYDRLCDALGIPGRMRSFSIKLSLSADVEITAKVEARSRLLAERKVREQFGFTSPMRAIEVTA